MAIIALRSPQYKSLVAGANSVYALCTIKIGGVLKYTLRKEVAPSETVVFEISELCRDFLNITFDGTYIPTNQTLTIQTEIIAYNSSGGLVNSTGDIDDIGHDAYGTFMEGANPEVPFGSRPTWLISPDPYGTLNNEYYVFIPTGVAGKVAYITAPGAFGYYPFFSNDIEISGTAAGTTLNIIRIDCTKYGIGHKITFVNKFGVLQDLWFFLKSVNTTNKKQEQFQRNIITSTGSYNVNTHTKQDYNTVANTSISLSSGYYPEWANQWFEQLLLSEQVWLTRTDPFDSSDTQVVPVNVRKNSMIQKTSLNERLIDYTFDFDMSFDYINNIR